MQIDVGIHATSLQLLLMVVLLVAVSLF
jgi:hypothetical protein